MKLTEPAQQFVLHWGEMGTAWGVNRSMAQIHALLFYHGTPMHAEEISETLATARSNVSTCLKELQSWGLVRVTHTLGDRRDYFESSGDVWQLFRTIVQERMKREFIPTVQMLRGLTHDSAFTKEDKATRERVEQTLKMMETLDIWAEEMLRLSPAMMEKVLKMGAGIQKFIRGKDKVDKAAKPAAKRAVEKQEEDNGVE